MKKNKILTKTKIILTLSLGLFFCFQQPAFAYKCPGHCEIKWLTPERACAPDVWDRLGDCTGMGSWAANICCVPAGKAPATYNKCPGRCVGGLSCNSDEEPDPLGSSACTGDPGLCCVKKGTGSINSTGPDNISGNYYNSNANNSKPPDNNQYKNQELIPGAGQTSDFVEYMKQIIRFGFAAIGILALFMLSVGAYQYLMAAGNLAKNESARETISSALLGLVLGLTAFLILRTINPQLVELKLTSPGGGTGGSGTSQPGTPGGKGTNYGNGDCVEVGSGPCSPENLASAFGAAANQASIICNVESHGNQMKASNSDICRGDDKGRPFSYGLFQINLTVHKIGGLDCPSAFSAKNYACTVVNEGLYQQCVQAAQNPETNINFAKSLYSKNNSWGDWKTTREKCGL